MLLLAIRQETQPLCYWFIGDPGWIRTSDPLLRRQMLYPTELRDRVAISAIEPFIRSRPRARDSSRSAGFQGRRLRDIRSLPRSRLSSAGHRRWCDDHKVCCQEFDKTRADQKHRVGVDWLMYQHVLAAVPASPGELDTFQQLVRSDLGRQNTSRRGRGRR